MTEELGKRLDSLSESMEIAKAEFEQATTCCVEAIQGMHQRIERLETWIEIQEKKTKI